MITPVPSYSSASRAGTPPRGRRVTVRSVPRRRTRSRSGASAIIATPDSAYVLRRSRACWSVLFAHLLRLRRNRLFSGDTAGS
jgi:hypothetical protein